MFFIQKRNSREFSGMALDQDHEQNNRVIKAFSGPIDNMNLSIESALINHRHHHTTINQPSPPPHHHQSTITTTTPPSIIHHHHHTTINQPSPPPHHHQSPSINHHHHHTTINQLSPPPRHHQSTITEFSASFSLEKHKFKRFSAHS